MKRAQFGPHDWLSLPVPAGSSWLLVDTLEPETAYQFSVLAQNKLGTSSFSEVVTVNTLGRSSLGTREGLGRDLGGLWGEGGLCLLPCVLSAGDGDCCPAMQEIVCGGSWMKLAAFAGCRRLWKACPESQHGRAVLCQSPFRSSLSSAGIRRY